MMARCGATAGACIRRQARTTTPQVISVGGTAVVSFMTDEDTSLHSLINGASAKIVTNASGGNSWGHKLTVSDVQSNWPGMLKCNDESIRNRYMRTIHIM
jgi:hypothetical protein